MSMCPAPSTIPGDARLTLPQFMATGSKIQTGRLQWPQTIQIINYRRKVRAESSFLGTPRPTSPWTSEMTGGGTMEDTFFRFERGRMKWNYMSNLVSLYVMGNE